MNPPSPCLIALDNPLPNLTLLDDDDEVDEDFEVASSSLGPTAPAFTSRKEPVSLLEGLLIDLADGSTVVFRPASGSKQDYLSPRPPPFGPSVHTRRSFIGPSATKSQLPTKKARAPLVELHLNTGSSAFTPDSDSPSPPWPLEDTPEVTPPSSFSSRASSPGFLPPSAVHDQPILIYTPKEVADPFKLDATSDHPHEAEAKSTIEVLVELGDEDMIDEVDELVEKFTRTTIYAPKPISTAREEGKDEERLIDIGSSDIQTRLNQAVSPLLQFEPYKDHPDDAASSNSFGLKAQPSSVVQLPRSPYAIYSSSPSPRLNVPAHLLQPNPPDALQSTVMQSWSDTEPSPTTKRYTAKFLERLSDVINSRLGEKGSRRFKVDLFGSVSWGGTTGQGGDVDMVLLDRSLPQGYIPSMWRTPPGQTPAPVIGHQRVKPFNDALPRPYHLWTLARVLKDAGMTRVNPIVGASTPIIKFEDPQGPTQCDLNVNDLGGWYNSSLILHYCLISPHVLRPLIHALKLWASAHDLNDPSGAKGPSSMSSYCLTLMAIGYLQHLGCLPNLQANVAVPVPDLPKDTTDPEVIWVGWGKEQASRAHIGFDKSPPLGWAARNPDLTVGDAIHGFFSYFSRAISPSEDRFDYTSSVMSVLNGGVLRRQHPVGIETTMEEQKRNEMKNQELPLDGIAQAMADHRQGRLENEQYMGKGDTGIQPRNWGDRKIVVQDPFLWQKNCAGTMSGKGVNRFGTAIDETQKLLSSRGPSATLQDILHDPNPIIRKNTPKGGRGRGRGRGGGPGRASPVSSPARGSPIQRQLFTP